MRFRLPIETRFFAALAFAIAIAVPARATTPAGGPYVPTPYLIAERMLALAAVGPADYLIDLGSGDGRLVIAAATKYKARGALGVEIDETLVRQASLQARGAGVADRVSFVAGDLFETSVEQATVVTLYLLPRILGEVEAKLRKELRPGARVVSHDYPLPTWKPAQVVTFDSPDKVAISGTSRTILYLYRVPDAR